MELNSLRWAMRHKVVLHSLHRCRLIVLLHATAIVVPFAGELQSATPGALTQAGTLLSLDSPELDSDSKESTASRIPVAMGALTLCGTSPTPATGLEKPIEIDAIYSSTAASFASSEMTAPLLSPISSETTFAALRTEDGMVGFEEMTPLPEPSTWLAACVALAFLAWHQRRRFLSRLVRVSVSASR